MIFFHITDPPVACPGSRKGGGARKSERLFFLLFNISRAQLRK